MAASIQVKRGTTAKVAAYTPLSGELVLDTTTNKLYAGDGSTVGGKSITADAANISGIIPVANGGTGQSDVSFVRAEDTTSVALAASTFITMTPAEITDTKSAYDPTTGIWTCPANGYYQIIGSVRFGAATTTTCTRMIKIDSATSPTASAVVGQTTLITAGANDNYLQVSTLISLSAGAKLCLYAYHTDTATMYALQKSLQIIRLR